MVFKPVNSFQSEAFHSWPFQQMHPAALGFAALVILKYREYFACSFWPHSMVQTANPGFVVPLGTALSTGWCFTPAIEVGGTVYTLSSCSRGNALVLGLLSLGIIAPAASSHCCREWGPCCLVEGDIQYGKGWELLHQPRPTFNYYPIPFASAAFHQRKEPGFIHFHPTFFGVGVCKQGAEKC